MASVPSAEIDGKTYLMVPHETGRVHQPGAQAVVISRREVEGVISVLERRKRSNHPSFNAGAEKKLSAYKSLLGS